MSKKVFLEFNGISTLDNESTEPCFINVDNILHVTYYEGDPERTCIAFRDKSYIVVDKPYSQVRYEIWRHCQ